MTSRPTTIVRTSGDVANLQNVRELARAIQDLQSGLLSNAKLVSTPLVTGDNRIVHGLARARGRIVVFVSAGVTLFDKEDTDPSIWILNSSGAATVTLIFF